MGAWSRPRPADGVRGRGGRGDMFGRGSYAIVRRCKSSIFFCSNPERDGGPASSQTRRCSLEVPPDAARCRYSVHWRAEPPTATMRFCPLRRRFIHFLQQPAPVVVILNHLPVGVGHGLYAVPTVVLVLHLEGVGPGFKRKRKSANIFSKFAEFAVTREVPRRIRRFPQMAFGDVCRFYAHVGLDLLFEIRELLSSH